MLVFAACIYGETTIFGKYYKDALRSLSLHVSTARLRVSVYIIKMLAARCCCMHQWRDRDFWYMLYQKLIILPEAYQVRCVSLYYVVENSLSLYETTARPQFSVIYYTR